MFTSFVTDGQTDGRTDGHVENIMPAAGHRCVCKLVGRHDNDANGNSVICSLYDMIDTIRQCVFAVNSPDR